jgi:hypothetical protein
MNLKAILIILIFVIFISAIIVTYIGSFNINHSCNELTLPGGYTCTNFTVVKVLEDTTCKNYTDCTNKLPLEYARMSSCPHQAICLSDKCTVVCPSHN